MNFYATHYRSGEEIRAGDHVLWAGKPGTVVFVFGCSEVPADWDWLGEVEGFMLDTETGGWVFQNESDEDLEFLGGKP